MKYVLTIILGLFQVFCVCQEICHNGKDDDNDGLIDLNDPDCACNDSLPLLNYIKNASFEDHTCPENYPVELFRVAYWYDGYRDGNGVDYFNLNCPYKFFDYYGSPKRPPIPLPEGKGYIGIRYGGVRGANMSGGNIFAGTCLANTLQSGKKYVFECFVGFSPDDKMNSLFKSPVNIGIYGNVDCNAYPYQNENNDVIRCPLDIGKNWVELGKVTVSGNSQWVKARINFIAPTNTNAFLLGATCENRAGNLDENYFYADQFSLAGEEDFAFKTITVSRNCTSGIQLTAPIAVNASVQWYKDSIAVVGATGRQFNVPPNANSASYNVRISYPTGCIISSPVNISKSNIDKLSLGADTVICSGETLRLRSNISTTNYRWQDGSRDSIFVVKQSGTYSLTLTDDIGCSSTSSINVKVQLCSDCKVEIPNAFTPNGDGRNDVFKILSSCLMINHFSLKVYNRWGQKIFETNQVEKGWTGKLKDIDATPGTYMYQLQYSKYGSDSIIKKGGILVLIR